MLGHLQFRYEAVNIIRYLPIEGRNSSPFHSDDQKEVAFACYSYCRKNGEKRKDYL